MARAVELIGERGKDYVDIWHSPESPNEVIKYGAGNSFLKFRGGILVSRTEGEDAYIENAASKGGYTRSDPNIDEPFECLICGSLWFSQNAFTRHTKFAHTGSMTRR